MSSVAAIKILQVKRWLKRRDNWKKLESSMMLIELSQWLDLHLAFKLLTLAAAN